MPKSTEEAYIANQKANQKAYELCTSDAEKREILNKMMILEQAYINSKIISSSESKIQHPTVPNEQLSVEIPQPEKATPAKKIESGDRPMLASFDKITPENIFDKVSAKDSTGKSVDLKKLLGNDPKATKQLCDAINKVFSQSLQKQFGGNKEGMQLVEENGKIGMKFNPNIVEEPDNAVKGIMDRTQNIAQQLAANPSSTAMNPPSPTETIGEQPKPPHP